MGLQNYYHNQNGNHYFSQFDESIKIVVFGSHYARIYCNFHCLSFDVLHEIIVKMLLLVHQSTPCISLFYSSFLACNDCSICKGDLLEIYIFLSIKSLFPSIEPSLSVKMTYCKDNRSYSLSLYYQ